METAHYYGSWGRVPRLRWSLQNKLQMKNFKQRNDKVNFSLEKFTPFAGWRQGVRKSFLKAERAVVIVQMKMAYDIVFIQILFFFLRWKSLMYSRLHMWYIPKDDFELLILQISWMVGLQVCHTSGNLILFCGPNPGLHAF